MKKTFLIFLLLTLLTSCSFLWLHNELKTPNDPKEAIVLWQQYAADLLDEYLGFAYRENQLGYREISYKIDHPSIRSSGVISWNYIADARNNKMQWKPHGSFEIQTFRPLIPTPFDSKVQGDFILGNDGTHTYFHADNITIESASVEQTALLKKIITPFIGQDIMVDLPQIRWDSLLSLSEQAHKGTAFWLFSPWAEKFSYKLSPHQSFSFFRPTTSCTLSLDAKNYHLFTLVCGDFIWSTMEEKFLLWTWLGQDFYITTDRLFGKRFYHIDLTDRDKNITSIVIEEDSRNAKKHTWSIQGEAKHYGTNWKIDIVQLQDPKTEIIFDFPENFTTFSDIAETPIQ